MNPSVRVPPEVKKGEVTEGGQSWISELDSRFRSWWTTSGRDRLEANLGDREARKYSHDIPGELAVVHKPRPDLSGLIGLVYPGMMRTAEL